MSKRPLSMRTSLDLGFGIVLVYRRSSPGQKWQSAYDYIRRVNDTKPAPTMQRVENMARKQGGFWRVCFEGPMSSATYERTTLGEWRQTAAGTGFA